LIGPIAASNDSIPPSRCTNSVIAASPPFGVNIGSGAPMRTRFLPRLWLRTLATQKVPFP